MKVICIDDRFDDNECNPSMGEVVTVLGECPIYPENYDIIEYPKDKFGKPQSFDKRAFAPISDIDETEMIREYNLTPEKFHAHQLSWYAKRLKEETRIEAKSFLRAELHNLKKAKPE